MPKNTVEFNQTLYLEGMPEVQSHWTPPIQGLTNIDVSENLNCECCSLHSYCTYMTTGILHNAFFSCGRC